MPAARHVPNRCLGHAMYLSLPGPSTRYQKRLYIWGHRPSWKAKLGGQTLNIYLHNMVRILVFLYSYLCIALNFVLNWITALMLYNATWNKCMRQTETKSLMFSTILGFTSLEYAYFLPSSYYSRCIKPVDEVLRSSYSFVASHS